MRNIKLTIEYDGTQFLGWQIQKNNSRTLQGEIQKILSKLCGEKIRLTGSGRTDSGVHALGQIANFKTASSRPLEQLIKALNALLPEDVAIIDITEVPLRFHAQYSAKSKIYRYTILNRNIRCAIKRNYCLFHPWTLNLPLMHKESKALMGRHNFKAFQSADAADKLLPFEKNTVRNITRIDIKKRGDLVEIELEANGFLYKMARNIVGALLEVGSGRLPKGSIKAILAKKFRLKTIRSAPAQGLCLMKVKY